MPWPWSLVKPVATAESDDIERGSTAATISAAAYLLYNLNDRDII